jgi:hypothetical protein
MATQTLAPANTVLGQIERQTNDWRTRLAMAFGAGIEGGNLYSGPWGVGDQGHSFGPFQINQPFHPTMNATSATNPHDAVAYMLASYQSAVGQVSAALWKSNPEKAAEQATFIAERPAQDYYVARGTGAVDAAYRQAVAGLSGAPAAAGAQTIASTGKTIPAPPYSSTPKGPWTSTIRQKMVAWIETYLNAGKIPGVLDPKEKAAFLAGTSDKQLGAMYSQELSSYKAGDGGALNPPVDPNIVPSVPGTGWIADVVKQIVGPVEKFLANGAIVLMGLVVIIVALVMLSKSDDDTNPSAPSSFGGGGNSAQRATEGRSSDVEKAAVAE